MKKKISVKKLNSSIVFVDTTPTVLEHIVKYFQCRPPNYMFDKRYRNGWWDGYVRLFSPSTQYLPIGLVPELVKFARKSNYDIEVDFKIGHKISASEFKKFVDSLQVQIKNKDGKIDKNAKVRPYQLKAAYDAITQQQLCIEVPTSGGKTLISYLIARYLESLNLKTLMIVPTTTLVEQTYGDWFDYGWDEVRDKVHKIYAGQEKYFNAAVTISTWQSLYRNEKIFENFDAVIIDEAHGAASNGKEATKMQNIAKWCCNAEWRIGMSGTLPDRNNIKERLAYLNLVGSLGPVRTYTTYEEMEKEGWIPKLKINVVQLIYDKETKEKIVSKIRATKESNALNIGKKKDPFTLETDLINNLEQRNEFIYKLISKSCNGNVMILFTKKNKHGLPLKKYLEKKFDGKRKIIYVDGDVDTQKRNELRFIIEQRNDVVLLASYGTFSTGISIKNIKSLIFASSYRSKIKVIQSIGRGLRKMDGKTEVKVFDLVDDICLDRNSQYGSYVNYVYRHFKEDRKAIYESKGFSWELIKYEF